MNKTLIYLFSILLVAVFLIGCGDDEVIDNMEPVGADPFTFTVSESISDTEVIGVLMAEDEAADLTFSISVNSDGLFEVTPDGELSLAAGRSLDYEEAVRHSIVVAVTDANQTGSYVVTINVTDDTVDNIMASFAVTSIEEFELTESSEIVINLSEPVLTEGYTVTVNIDPGTSIYSVDYTTEPDGTTGTFEVPVGLGQSSASFMVEITNDLEEEGDETLSFTLANGANDLIIPASENATLDFTVIDDDQLELYLYLGQPGGVGAITTLYTVNAKSGAQVALTEITLDGAPLEFPLQIEWSSDNSELYVTASGATLYSADITTGEATLEVDFWTDYQDQFPELTNPPSFSATYLEGSTLYLILSGVDAAFTSFNYLASFDISTGAVSVMGVDLSSLVGSPAGIGLINDQVHLIGQNIDDDDGRLGFMPIAFNVDDGTLGAEFTISYSPDLESVTGHIAGVNTIPSGDLVDNTFISQTAFEFEPSGYHLMYIDPASGEISRLVALETLDISRGLTIIPTADLAALGF